MSGSPSSQSWFKCDACGRFCNRLYNVPCNPSYLGIDREVCEKCADLRGLVGTSGSDE